MKKQHEPLRIPERWQGQDRMLVVQIDRILDEIYNMLGNLEKRIAELEQQGG